MRRMLGLAAAATTGLVALAVVAPGGPPPDSRDDTRPRDRAGLVAAGGALVGFDACDDLLDHLRQVATRDPWGGDLGGGMWAVEETAAESAAGADGDARSSAPAAADVTGTSDTNVQVAGVDEPDLVETDGRRVWTATEGRLRVVDVSGPSPERLADVDLGLPHDGDDAELLLDGDRLLVLARGWSDVPVRGVPEDGAAADMVMPMGTPVATLVLFDVGGDMPVEVARAEVEGELVAGRGVDGTAHLVVAHRPQPIAMPLMEPVWAAPDEDVAADRLRTALASTTATDWLPGLRTTAAASGAVTTTTSVDCADVVRPVDTEDGSLLQVLTFDVHAGDLDPEAATAVLTDARHVTATATELVVATPVWHPAPANDPAAPPPGEPAVERMIAPVPEQGTTRLHLFDLGPAGTTHRASGEVPGMLLNQFSMSLHDGTLRVATTVGQPWDGTSESGVTVLRREGDRLEAIGTVGGLGRGETIHAVRFLGDRAYVVTFRQTDPLYTIDLTDPTAPRVTGELKITGYSAYLHPLGGDHLLGVGQEATLEGMVTGTQVSVFDVADAAAPTRVSQVLLPGATSEAEWDHHAVLVHDGVVVLPYERWAEPTPERPEGFESAAVVLGLDGDALTLRGTVASTADAADPWRSAIRRVLVVDGRLVTVSRGEVAVHDPVSLETTGTARL